MPWLIDGTFERITNNTQENGISLWQQDLSNNVKVIAYRHDFHDHDLAGGIADCLNLDGYNAMRANLDMGNYNITNILEGVNNGDVAVVGQTIGEMTYDDEGPSILAVFDKAGNKIDEVTIVAGEGGTGTVYEINVGPGLQSTQNPIVSLADLDLAFAATPGQSYSGGIAGIVIDDYGRVTQVTTGGFANTNLSVVTYPGFVNIFSSTGSDATIPRATASRAGVVSADDWNKLQAAPTLSGQNQWSGDNNFLSGGSSKFGSQSVPTILNKGLQINPDGNIFAVNLPTTAGSTGQLYNNGDGILRVS